MRVIALLVTFGVTFVACGNDKSPSQEARDDVCDASSNLRADLTDVVDDVRAANLGEAGDKLSDVSASIDELSTAAGNLTEAQRAAVQPQIDAIRSTLNAVTVSDLENLGPTIDTISNEVNQAIDAIGESELNCS